MRPNYTTQVIRLVKLTGVFPRGIFFFVSVIISLLIRNPFIVNDRHPTSVLMGMRRNVLTPILKLQQGQGLSWKGRPQGLECHPEAFSPCLSFCLFSQVFIFLAFPVTIYFTPSFQRGADVF